MIIADSFFVVSTAILYRVLGIEHGFKIKHLALERTPRTKATTETKSVM
jgi:hypothetical protein